MAMSDKKRPKVLLFDIGGVCVVSPFQAILDHEKQNGIPNGYINFAISASKPNGSWQKLERGEALLNEAWFRSFKADIERPEVWQRFHLQKQAAESSAESRAELYIPPIPTVDAELMYWTMMSTARDPDPYMAPALQKLKADGQWRLAALSNTSIFPPGHEFNETAPNDIRTVFDVFVSSAHVGMRKPDRNIYELTMKKLREKWPDQDLQPEDIVFFDDIGENLKMAKQVGWTTVKVWLGRTEDAVKELERITGCQLLEKSKKDSKL